MKIWLFVATGVLAFAQANPTQRGVAPAQAGEPAPVFRVTVVSRTVPSINYRHRGGATKVDFKGTVLLPEARGEAKVESKQGYIEVEVEFDDINSPASKFGPEYLTYVMWAITPEGRATNLGEVILNGNRSKLNVTTELQAFALIVTAEPYFAVSQPSDVVVMENVVRRDTMGKTDVVDAKYELLQRGQYTMNVNAGGLPASGSPASPLDLREARNAVNIARHAGADKFAADTFQKAARLLAQAEDYQKRKQRKPAAMTAREATQTAADARTIALRRQEEERLARERQLAAEREAEAKAQAEASEAAKRAVQEQARQAAEQARAESERMKREAEAAARRAAAEREAAEAARQWLTQEAEAARTAAETAEKERAELRERLRQQLNQVLETRDSARGLILNMSDVLFDTGKYTLKPGAREKLARVAGILLAHPDLRLEIEGHTDAVGSDEYNQKLSEQRAMAVRDYLISQGVDLNTVAARGFGETTPVASNDTSAGRQQNRRVEVVVSGEAIGNRNADADRSTVPARP